MKCPFQKEIIQEQQMPTTLTPNDPPKVIITEYFRDCNPEECRAAFQTADDGWECKLCGKEY